ncbi:meiosis protein SPO22/ZIP4 like-domain-containing protein [Xylariomycetidae sp. FL0641]|nr:meiosis protein SPO22/ZIP4 like-domain-containing protein [Xylariomycetidae sp. FL0641]
MESNGGHAKDRTSDSDAKSKDNTPTTTSTTNTPTDTNKSPRKRRKVNHACVYCRRSERPCTRCIKRNIGHLCHDEPRDPDAKKPKGTHGASSHDESDGQTELSRNSIDQTATAMAPPSFDGSGGPQSTKPGFGAAALRQANPLQLVSPNSVSGMQANPSGSNMNQFAGFSDAWLTAQSQFHDMHHYNPQYMLPQEVTHEFNLLNDFLNTSLLDEGGNLPDDQNLLYRNGQNQPPPSGPETAGFLGGNNGNMLPQSTRQPGSMLPPNAEQTSAMSRPIGAAASDKTREFYLQAADPSGNDTPEARMERVLKAKYDAGMLKPFNYIKGYARLSRYMDGHIASASKQKILRQLDKFRPKFREKVQGLTDIELVYVEMWFEKTLMEYDRVFAAMAVPACCWRRTGEIFRGNKEMAELIHVPVERLRDGKVSLHEILTEESLVRYWEEFGTIAFDASHDTLLTACALKNPDDRSNDPIFGRPELLASIHTNQVLHSSAPLWNWCTQLKRQGDGTASPARAKFLTLVRVFSFFILALAQWGDSNTHGDLARLEKLAIKAGRSCIANGQLELAMPVLQKAAEYNGLLQNLQGNLPKEELIACKRSETEYLGLRIVLAWREGRMDVAEHVYSKMKEKKPDSDPTSAEKLADALFEVGKGLSAQKNFLLAAKWLQRAFEFINSQELEQLSREAIELRLAISQALVQAYLTIDGPEGLQSAENHVKYMESELGDKLVVLILRLELLLCSPSEVFDCNSYANVLHRMIRSVDVTHTTYKIIVHHIRKLDDKSPGLAVAALDEFVVSRLMLIEYDDWIERAILLRTHMTTVREDTAESVKALSKLFEKVETSRGKPLAAAPALGVQTLVWAKIESNFNQGQLDVAEEWCQLALHSLLKLSGPQNTAKLNRKLLLCGLQKNNLDSATALLNSMGESTRTETMTMYLSYKLALRTGDRDLAFSSLAGISEASKKDPQYLYACCLDAQQAHDKLCTLEALRHLVGKYDHASSSTVHLPALLRVLIRLEVSLLNAGKQEGAIDPVTLVEDIINVFEAVLYQTLRKVVNCIWRLERFDTEKLAKYMRCLLKVTIPLEPELGLKVMEEINSVVKQSADSQVSFPHLELEWLATTAFNHGADLFGMGEDELSKKWVAHAFTLAHLHEDGGKLEKELQDKHLYLNGSIQA